MAGYKVEGCKLITCKDFVGSKEMQENMSPGVLILKHTPSHFLRPFLIHVERSKTIALVPTYFSPDYLLSDQILNMPESPST